MRYFSAKADRLVTRYGTNTYIGASVTAKAGEKPVITSNEKVVVAISDAEFAKYGREYLRLEREGSLIKRTQADFDAMQKAEAEASKKEADALKAQADKAAAEAKAQSDKEAADREAEAKKAAAAAKAATKASE